MIRFYKKLYATSAIKLVFWAVFINLGKSAFLIIAGVYANYFDVTPLPISVLTAGDILKIIGSHLIISPLLETFLFQYLIIILFDKYKPGSWKVALLLSATVFALFHTEVKGSMYVFYLFDKWIGGAVLAMLFIILKKRGKAAFLYTALTHAIINGTLLLYVLYKLALW